MNNFYTRNKKAEGLNVKFLVIILLIFLGIFIFSYIFQETLSDVFSSKLFSNSEKTSYEFLSPSEIFLKQFSLEENSAIGRALNLLGNVLSFVIGKIPLFDGHETGMSSLIVAFCILGMIILAFGDILRNLSFFSEKISWIISILLGIAFANLGFLGEWLIKITHLFAALGVVAVYAGLFASFLAFLAVEFGISKFGPWLMRRRAMQESSKFKTNAESGADKLEGTITSLGKIGDALSGLGKK